MAPEPSVSVNNLHDETRYERSVMSKLGWGNLPLAVRVGCYTQQALHDRICTICISQKFENKLYFVIDYSFY